MLELTVEVIHVTLNVFLFFLQSVMFVYTNEIVKTIYQLSL